ncbi:MAG: thiamine phosphate synthase [Aureispira sp.]|nr:thiamine phosphate synthase [Aureispira sp.]
MSTHISKLQYISQGDSPKEHLQQIEAICKAGGDWVQLRLKNVDSNTYIQTAQEAKTICQKYAATLIINDNVEVAKTINADGVHLGQGDMNWLEARKILGTTKIIGATANSIEHIQHIMDSNAEVDYIGVGPFRHTTTKKKLSPILGLEGYQKLLDQLKSKKFDIPIIAIGGILVDDIAEILGTGVYGIAVSGLLSQSTKKSALIDKVHTILGANP